MRIHESGIDRSPDTPNTSKTSTAPSPTLAPSPCAPITTTTITTVSSVDDIDTAVFSCPHCPRHSLHVSARSVTCVSIAQRLRNQCPEHQPTPTKLVSTAHTVLALSGIAWAYLATCSSTTASGRQPPAASHHHTLPPRFTNAPPLSPLTHRKHPPATFHASGKCASRLGSHAAPAARLT
ncbi:hypothetical protein SprV_1002859600 [Sparganum proliferum]